MNKILFFIIFFSFLNSFGQNFYLKLNGNDPNENKVIDSIEYIKNHSTQKLLNYEVKKIYEKTQKLGFLESRIKDSLKVSDSTYSYHFELGKRTKFIHVYIGEENKVFFDVKLDTLKMKFSESEDFLLNLSQRIESKGYSISKTRLINISNSNSNNFVSADLDIELDRKRIVNEIVINGYDKFPIGFKKIILKKYKNKVFNQENLEGISNDFKSIRFIKQLKYPEILFSKDTTKVYVYIEKKNNNSFDGFLGFSNSEKKLIFNGYVDLNLNNILNSGDVFSIKWRNDGKKQTNFNIGAELPFIFKTPFGLKLQLNIFKQDSTFQNSKTDIDIAYFLNNKSKLFIGYQSTESSDINNVNSSLLNDFNNNFFTTSYEFINSKDDRLFQEKSNFFIKLGYGKRDSKFNSDNQFVGIINLSHIFEINNNNSIFISSQNYYLQSNSYLINELHRFGGIKSIRGFKENSLQANRMNLLISEYRYKFTPNLYLHSIVDYGYFKDNTTNFSNKPLGFGIGFGLLTTNGVLNFIYANSVDNKQVVTFSNSIIHISFKSFF